MSDEFFFNPLDESTRRDPYSIYAAGRERGAYAHPGLGVTSVFRYDDCVSMLKDHQTWSNVFPPPEGMPERGFGPPGMISTDPPAHDRLRGLVNLAFTPRIIRQREQRMKEIAGELVESAIAEGSVDIVQALTYPLPTMVIAEIIGIPIEDRAQFKRWSDEIVANLGLGLIGQMPDENEIAAALGRRRKMGDYFEGLAERRRSAPQEDLLSGLVQAEIDGEKLDQDELLSMLILLLVAGNETTTTLIGNCIVTLLENPDQLERLRADPSLIVSAVDEVLRFASPIQVDPRCATRDIELRGEKVSKDQIVLLWLGAANRDPEIFDNPEEFDIGRQNNRHLAFGFGTHFCLGNNLAKLETQIAVQALLERAPKLELASDDPLPLHPSFVFRSFKSIPLRLDR